jgi:hypothetical protein
MSIELKSEILERLLTKILHKYTLLCMKRITSFEAVFGTKIAHHHHHHFLMT